MGWRVVPGLALLLLSGLAAAEDAKPAEPKRGDVVYLAGAWTRNVRGMQTEMGNVPSDRVQCYGTNDCRWESRACDPFVFRSQSDKRTSVRSGPGGVLNALLWRLDGDFRAVTYLDRASCMAHVERWCATPPKDDAEKQAQHFVCVERAPK